MLLACSFGCAPSSSQLDSKQNPPDSALNDLPELTEEVLRERINGTRVRQVPEENGTAEPISWSFDEEEPKEIAVVQKQMEGERATIFLDIKTTSAPGALAEISGGADSHEVGTANRLGATQVGDCGN